MDEYIDLMCLMMPFWFTFIDPWPPWTIMFCRFLITLPIFGTDEAMHFSFGTQIERGECQLTDKHLSKGDLVMDFCFYK